MVSAFLLDIIVSHAFRHSRRNRMTGSSSPSTCSPALSRPLPMVRTTGSMRSVSSRRCSSHPVSSSRSMSRLGDPDLGDRHRPRDLLRRLAGGGQDGKGHHEDPASRDSAQPRPAARSLSASPRSGSRSHRPTRSTVRSSGSGLPGERTRCSGRWSGR